MKKPSRQLQYHRRLRAKLIEALGGICKRCGTDRRLEFDHIKPAEWCRARYGRGRICLYWREFKAGVKLQLLCRKCNAKKGNKQLEF